ncbi:hypothetical protein P22_3161 [Propionispora sp. 2/2-37]|nr:hypothetical protein P22_3161 [Propionispora sp. 2/2-37]
MKPIALKCEYLINLLGIDIKKRDCIGNSRWKKAILVLSRKPIKL